MTLEKLPHPVIPIVGVINKWILSTLQQYIYGGCEPYCIRFCVLGVVLLDRSTCPRLQSQFPEKGRCEPLGKASKDARLSTPLWAKLALSGCPHLLHPPSCPVDTQLPSKLHDAPCPSVRTRLHFLISKTQSMLPCQSDVELSPTSTAMLLSARLSNPTNFFSLLSLSIQFPLSFILLFFQTFFFAFLSS